MAGRLWGGDRKTLTTIYRATVLEKLLYAAPIISGMSEANIKKLETIHNTGLRAISGAFYTSPINSIQAEVGIPSYKTLLDQRTAMYTARNIKNENPDTNQQNLLGESTDWSDASNSSGEMWGSTSNAQQFTTAVGRGDNVLRELRMDLPRTNRFIRPKSAPWERNLIPVDKKLLKEIKQGKSQEELRQLFVQRKNTKYRMSTHIYTDGSKQENRCGYSVVCGDFVVRKRINGMSSIFAAESLAIKDSVLWILDQPNGKDFVIFTDSLSAISALEKRKINSKWRDEMSSLYTKLQIKQISLHICWVSSHVGIPGNEKADEQAKLALLETVLQTNEVDYKEVRTQIKNKISERWQTQ